MVDLELVVSRESTTRGYVKGTQRGTGMEEGTGPSWTFIPKGKGGHERALRKEAAPHIVNPVWRVRCPETPGSWLKLRGYGGARTPGNMLARKESGRVETCSSPLVGLRLGIPETQCGLFPVRTFILVARSTEWEWLCLHWALFPLESLSRHNGNRRDQREFQGLHQR